MASGSTVAGPSRAVGDIVGAVAEAARTNGGWTLHQDFHDAREISKSKGVSFSHDGRLLGDRFYEDGKYLIRKSGDYFQKMAIYFTECAKVNSKVEYSKILHPHDLNIFNNYRLNDLGFEKSGCKKKLSQSIIDNFLTPIRDGMDPFKGRFRR